MVEIYGKIKETLTIGKETKNLAYLSRKLYEAASLEVKMELLTKDSTYTAKLPSQLDSFLDKLETQLGAEKFNKKDLKTALEQ